MAKLKDAKLECEAAVWKLVDFDNNDVRLFAYGFLTGYGLSEEEVHKTMFDMNNLFDRWNELRGPLELSHERG